MQNEDVVAVYKLLIWLILPEDIFFNCFCKPLLQDEVHEIRSKLEKSILIKEWLIQRFYSGKILDHTLPDISIEPISSELSNWLRSSLDIEEDIDKMKDYSKFSAFDLHDSG